MFKPRSLVEEIAYQLENSQTQALARLTDVNPGTIIYREGGWRIQDIIAHLTVWEEEIARSLQAYQYKSAYRIPDFELQAFNVAHYQQRKILPARQVFADWMNIRVRLKQQVGSMTLEKLAGVMTFPSGRWGECGVLVCEIMSHQGEHLDDILRIINGG
jgi:hypothetical protein